MYFPRVTILGVGLIGASVALAAKAHRLSGTVIGYGRTKENLERARERGIIDAFEQDAAKACADADLIVFATPVGVFRDLARQISGSLKNHVIVTDVGSVKGPLVHDMEQLLAPAGLFVGGHPIAGSDRSGIDTASASLFRQNRCIITPTRHTEQRALDSVIRMWQTFGANITLMDPEEHDRIYAAVSHLPHLLAYALMNTIADIDENYLAYAGQGFKDVTRIAASHPILWRDICRQNRENIIACIERYRNRLDRVVHCLRDDEDSLLREFQTAQALRERIGQD